MDAMKVTYQKEENSIDFFAGGTKIHDPLKISLPFTKTEFWGGGIYGHYSFPKWIAVEPFYVYKRQGSADFIKNQEINRKWLGARIFNDNFHQFIIDLTAVQEFGSENGKNINAYACFVKAGYQFHPLPAKPILSLRESYASGGKKSSTTIRTFDPAFGASDKYYGWMNITTWSNLDDREIVLELFPVKAMWVEMKYNRFFIPETEDFKLLNTIKLQAGKNHLGDEFDLFIRYQVKKNWQFTGALGKFIPGDLMPINNQPAKQATWFSIQILYSI
jgi:hypothetical protein